MSLVADPQARTTELTQNDFQVSFVYEPARRVAVLYAWGLASLPVDQAYQAWLIRPEGEPIDAGVFTVSPDSPFVWRLITSPEPLQNFARFNVTVEPVGGSPGPSETIVFGTDL